METRSPSCIKLKKGFIAKPKTNEDGSVDLMKWNCVIPGPPEVNILNSHHGNKDFIILLWNFQMTFL